MQSDSQRLQECRETIAYQQLSVSSHSPNISMESNETDERFTEFNMNDSKYSKVIFSEISGSYPTDADIECRFYIGDSVVPSHFDKIGLFRVGWIDANECLIVKNVEQCETDEFGEKRIRFNASELPKQGDEFYQFCYLTPEDVICGASTPFRFLRPHNEDLIQLDNRNSDEDDFVVVRSQQALLQERVEHLINSNGVLEYSKRSLEQQIAQLSNELNELRKNKVESEDRLKLSQLELVRVMDKLKISEENNSVQTEHIEHMEKELNDLIQMKNDCDKQIENSQIEYNKVYEALKAIEVKDIDCEQQLKCRDHEIYQLSRKTADQQVLMDEMSSSKAFIEAELELSRTTIAKVMSERRDLDAENKMLRNELEDIKAKCDTLEGNKDIMMKEILDLEKIKLKTKVELKCMVENMDDMRKRLDQNELSQMSMSEEWKAKEEDMEKQVSEMKLRLTHAAEEYQKLFKYKTKLEGKVDRIKAKVKNYFDTKSKTRSVSNASPTDQELMAAETEVKTVIESETTVEPTYNPLMCASNEASGGKLESITIITLPCSVCREEITCTAHDLKPMTLHLEEKHSQRLCPICSMLFDSTLPGHHKYFEMHVENHFDVPNYPPPTAPASVF